MINMHKDQHQTKRSSCNKHQHQAKIIMQCATIVNMHKDQHPANAGVWQTSASDKAKRPDNGQCPAKRGCQMKPSGARRRTGAGQAPSGRPTPCIDSNRQIAPGGEIIALRPAVKSLRRGRGRDAPGSFYGTFRRCFQAS
jgi:hypothetical protein